jgi:hypothetical protein
MMHVEGARVEGRAGQERAQRTEGRKENPPEEWTYSTPPKSEHAKSRHFARSQHVDIARTCAAEAPRPRPHTGVPRS